MASAAMWADIDDGSIDLPIHYGNHTAPYDDSLRNDTRKPLVLSVAAYFMR